MRIQTFTLLPLVAALLLISCEKDAEEIQGDLVGAPHPNTVVGMSMSYTHDGAPYDTSITLTDGMGRHFKITQMRFFMGRFGFTDDAGDSVAAFPEKYLLVDLEDGGMIRNIGEVDGQLHMMNIALGVEEALNHEDPMTLPAPLNDMSMVWTWAQGHLFLTINGRYDHDQDGVVEADTSDRNFSFACGDDTLYTTTALQVNTVADMGGNVVIPLDLNIDTLMAHLNIAGMPVVHEVTPVTRALMEQLAAGLSHVE